MDFRFSDEDENFRSEFRTWLEANLPDGHRKTAFTIEFFANEEGEEWEKRLAWHQTMHAAGWIAVQYPKQYGGRGASITQQYIYDEELNRVGAPQLVNGQGIGLVGPTLMHWGTEEQRRRYLPKMLAAEEIWCQGYSEPGSGSDLASLQTRAIEDGDDFVVNGQKVWTSDAHHADMCFLLVRTDPAAPKHKGISYLLVDMHSPGITVRPLVQMTGDRGFNEMFFEDVRVPKKNLVGEKNNGWLVALTSLMFERRARDMTPIVHELAALARLVRSNGLNGWDDSRVRQRIAEFACEAWAIRYVGLRQLTRQLKGLPPGPESSIQKLAYSELNLRIQKFAMELLGAYGQMTYQAPLAIDEGKWSYRILAARGMILGAGTSEIQRNIIGERVLGLPKG
ncbi:MAG: acyl-CoA dehydrogenase family protein [Deltaproteobacteria bacterium]|nr:acyl-CoA dehydrogenase family protein [Deltaproteobacteria bacterium]